MDESSIVLVVLYWLQYYVGFLSFWSVRFDQIPSTVFIIERKGEGSFAKLTFKLFPCLSDRAALLLLLNLCAHPALQTFEVDLPNWAWTFTRTNFGVVVLFFCHPTESTSCILIFFRKECWKSLYVIILAGSVVLDRFSLCLVFFNSKFDPSQFDNVVWLNFVGLQIIGGTYNWLLALFEWSNH